MKELGRSAEGTGVSEVRKDHERTRILGTPRIKEAFDPTPISPSGLEKEQARPAGERPMQSLFFGLEREKQQAIFEQARKIIRDPEWAALNRHLGPDKRCERMAHIADLASGVEGAVKIGAEKAGLPPLAASVVGKLAGYGASAVLPHLEAGRWAADGLRLGHVESCSHGTACPCAKALIGEAAGAAGSSILDAYVTKLRIHKGL